MPLHGFCGSCQVSNWSFCFFGESLRSIQDSGSLSSVSSPDRNLLFYFRLGSRRVSLGWTTWGFVGDSCSSSWGFHYCGVFLGFITSGLLTSPLRWPGLVAMWLGLLLQSLDLLSWFKVDIKFPKWPPLGSRGGLVLPFVSYGLKPGIQCPG